jgi:hypothetical protein
MSALGLVHAAAPAGSFLGVDWGAFVVVFVVAFVAAVVIVAFYAIGLRLLAVGSPDDTGDDGAVVSSARGRRPVAATIGGFVITHLDLNGVEVTVSHERTALPISHLCPRCGSIEHGVPSIVGSGRSVSLSRCVGFEVVATADVGPIGVDIESIGRIARHPVAAVLLHDSEAVAVAKLAPAIRDRRLAELWTAKEAILKATGWGLNVDLRLLALRGAGDAIELVDWPEGIGLGAAPRIRSFVLDADVVGAVAVLR